MEKNNSNLSISIDDLNDNIKYSIESVPEILPQYVVNDNDPDNPFVIEFNPKDLPNIITEQGKTLNDFCIQKEKAIEAAKVAKDKAVEANKKKVGWFTGKKVAIEELQSATVSISDALDSLTVAVNQSYKNQEKIAKVNEFLLGLGLTNTTLNRMVIRELEMKLNNASPEELSELAKQELMSVLRQLKAQEDIQNRLEKQAEGLRLHDETLEQLREKDNNLESVINQVKIDFNNELKSDIKNLRTEVFSHISDKIVDINKTIIEKENYLKSTVNQVKEDFNRDLKSSINDLRTEVINDILSKIEDINQTTTEKENNLKSSINQVNTELNNKLDSTFKSFEFLINDVTNRQNDTLETYKRENETLKNEANLLSQKVLKLQGQLKWYFVISVVASAIAVIGLII